MARRVWACAVLAFVGFVFAAGLSHTWAQEAQPQAVQNVVLISWDGLDRSVLKELMDAGKLPNLAAIAKEGVVQDIEVRGHVTVTKPGHAEMLTGLDVKDTGVYSNDKFAPIPEGYTIFERVQQHLGGKDKIHTFMVTGKLAHVGGRGPEDLKKATKAGAKGAKAGEAAPPGADDTVAQPKGEPFYLTKKALDVFDGGQRDADAVGPLCLNYLAQYKEPRFLAFLHFSDPDHAGHAHGIDSQEYRDAAVKCDEWLGKVVEWLKGENLYDKTLIYVMADHGFDVHGKSHSKAPHSWLVTNDKTANRSGIIADVPATILAQFGIDVEKLEPKLIGAPLSGPPSSRQPSAVMGKQAGKQGDKGAGKAPGAKQGKAAGGKAGKGDKAGAGKKVPELVEEAK